MDKIFLVYKTDARHSYASRDLLGVCTSRDNVMKIIRQQVKKEGSKLNADQIFNLENISQTQGYKGEGEFHFEAVTVDKLL